MLRLIDGVRTFHGIPSHCRKEEKEAGEGGKESVSIVDDATLATDGMPLKVLNSDSSRTNNKKTTEAEAAASSWLQKQIFVKIRPRKACNYPNLRSFGWVSYDMVGGLYSGKLGIRSEARASDLRSYPGLWWK